MITYRYSKELICRRHVTHVHENQRNQLHVSALFKRKHAADCGLVSTCCVSPFIIGVYMSKYSKTCIKRNAIVPVFFPFSQVSVLQRVVF